MALSKLSEDDLSKSLECSICFSDFIQPKQLPCLHTFCLKCLTEYCNNKTDNTTCPMCRREFSIPKGGVDKLRNNEFMMRLVLMKGVKEEKEESKCEICVTLGEDNEAEAFCIECQQCLCVRCQKCHSAQTSSKNHKIVGVEEKSSKETLRKVQSNFCLKHSREETRIYCCDCREVLCTVCHVQDHGKHNCKLFDEVIQQKNDAFKKNISGIKRCLNERYNKLNNLQQEREKTLSEVTQASDAIKETFSNVQKLLSSYESQLLNVLETSKAKRLKEIESQEDLNQFYNTELDSFLAYSRMVMERGTDCEIIRVADELHKRAEELIKSQDERNEQSLPQYSIRFVASPPPTIESLKSLVGKIIDSGSDANKITEPKETEERTASLNKDTTTTRFLSSNHVTGIKYIQMGYKAGGKARYGPNISIRGITVVDNQIFVIQREQSEVKVYDAHTYLALPDISPYDCMKDPQDIAGCSHNKVLYISDVNLKCIFRVKISNKRLVYWEVKSECNPLGLSVTSKKNILVTVSNTYVVGRKYLRNYYVLEYESEGQLIREIKLDKSFDGAGHTVQLSTDQFIVGNGSPSVHKLCVVNSVGQIIKKYGTDDQQGVGQLSHYIRLAVDNSRDVVFVVDRTYSKVFMFSRDLCFRGEVYIKKNLSDPSYLYFDSSTSRLLVGDEAGRLLIISLSLE